MLGTVMQGDITPDLESGQRVFHALFSSSGVIPLKIFFVCR